jgi:hypothetical protein
LPTDREGELILMLEKYASTERLTVKGNPTQYLRNDDLVLWLNMALYRGDTVVITVNGLQAGLYQIAIYGSEISNWHQMWGRLIAMLQNKFHLGS